MGERREDWRDRGRPRLDLMERSATVTGLEEAEHAHFPNIFDK